VSEDVREVGADAAVVGTPEAETGRVVTEAGGDEATELRTSQDPADDGPADQAAVDQDPADQDPADQDPAKQRDKDSDPSEAGTDSDNPLDSEAEIAADYLEELLDIADLDGDIDTYIEGDRAHVSVITESDVLVGRGGEVLDALQELTRLAVMTETGERSRLMLDVAGYRDRRRKELVELTTSAVAEVKDSGERLKLSPMNPFERKIVHDAVAEAGLTSESEGEEPSRCVVIIP